MPRTLELKRPGELRFERPNVNEKADNAARFIILHPGMNSVSEDDYRILRADKMFVRHFDARVIDDISGRDIDWKAIQPPVVADPEVQKPAPPPAIQVSSPGNTRPTAAQTAAKTTAPSSRA